MNSISPYTVKHFEIGLSPIIEDTHTFANTMRGPKSAERKPVASDVVDSSESSYGEPIQKKVRFFPDKDLPGLFYFAVDEHEVVKFSRP